MCTTTGYTYTHWNYTNLSIKSQFIFKSFPLVQSFVLQKVTLVTHFMGPHLC